MRQQAPCMEAMMQLYPAPVGSQQQNSVSGWAQGGAKSLGDASLILLRGTCLVFLADPHVLTTYFISENVFSLS